MRNIYKTTKVVHLLDASSISATTASAPLDIAGYYGVLLIINFGQWTFSSGSITPVLQESDDGTTWNDVSSTFYEGNLASISSTDGDQTTQYVSYFGNKRYVRINLVKTGTASGVVSVDGILTLARHNPVV